jgi:predicted nucleic acid-binding protein
MLAIDTNLVVRCITNDHPTESPQARALIECEDVFVCLTVVLETEWVLRGVYKYDPAPIARALRAFAGLAHVSIENAQAVSMALDWMAHGLDFADALHLATARNCDAFVSFDARLANAANKLGTLEVRTP